MYSESQIGDSFRMVFTFLRLTVIRNLSIAVLLAACGTALLFAGKHPVPLDKDTDGAKCLECHENKTKEKSIHTAVTSGCLSCHEVRVARDVTRVKLTTATVHLPLPAVPCRQESRSRPEALLHPPAGQDCTKCHDPHDSPNKDHLLKSLSGGTGPKIFASNVTITA